MGAADYVAPLERKPSLAHLWQVRGSLCIHLLPWHSQVLVARPAEVSDIVLTEK
jgi:hypothetical protein